MAKAGNPIHQIAIGQILKAQRQKLQITQNEIGKRLEYTGYNFISMLESSRSPLPLNRVVDIVKAYEFEDVFSLTDRNLPLHQFPVDVKQTFLLLTTDFL